MSDSGDGSARKFTLRSLTPRGLADRMVSTHASANLFIIILIILVALAFTAVGIFATHMTTDSVPSGEVQ